MDHLLLEPNASNPSFILSEVDFSLGGGVRTTVQLSVTPHVEGILDIIGVRWKLSESVVGYHNFDNNVVQKRVKGKRRPMKSPSNNLKFMIIKSLPKLEGSIHHIPERVYAGEIQRTVLELKNPSKFPVKNLKMKIHNPRFLYPGTLEDLKAEFPMCLEKQRNGESNNVQKSTSQSTGDFLFSFPEGNNLLMPLWLRAAAPGSIPLYISIYYETESVSNGMRYHTSRVHFNVEVLPSLDLSAQISRCPSRLREFLVRMDVVNKTSSQSFQLQQFSSINCQWEISSLPPNGIAFPSQVLVAGQALSRFFKLNVCINGVISCSRGLVQISLPFLTNLFELTCECSKSSFMTEIPIVP